MSQINFLTETLLFIKLSDLNVDDIEFIGSSQSKRDSGHSMSFEEFRKVADVTYDNSSEFLGVANDLVFRFKDNSAMYRNCQLGYQGWAVYKPTDSGPVKKITKLVAGDGDYSPDTYVDLVMMNPE